MGLQTRAVVEKQSGRPVVTEPDAIVSRGGSLAPGQLQAELTGGNRVCYQGLHLFSGKAQKLPKNWFSSQVRQACQPASTTAVACTRARPVRRWPGGGLYLGGWVPMDGGAAGPPGATRRAVSGGRPRAASSGQASRRTQDSQGERALRFPPPQQRW